VYLVVVHNCCHRSEGHHGEGVKEEIRSVDMDDAGLATALYEGIGPPYLRPKQRFVRRNSRKNYLCSTLSNLLQLEANLKLSN